MVQSPTKVAHVELADEILTLRDFFVLMGLKVTERETENLIDKTPIFRARSQKLPQFMAH